MNYVYIAHSGVPNQKWGIRRYQNYDGSLTPLGRIHYGVGKAKEKIGIKSDDETDKKVMAQGKKEEEAKAAKKKAAEEEAAAKKKAAEEEAAAKKKKEAEVKKAEEEAKEAEAKRKAAEAEAEAKKKEAESKNNSKSEEEEKANYSSKKILSEKSVSELTDTELQNLINRIRNEKTVSELTYNPTTGDKIKTMLKDTGKEALKSAGEYAVKYAASRVLDAALSNSGGSAQAKEILGDKFYKRSFKKTETKNNNNNNNQTKTTKPDPEKVKQNDATIKKDKSVAKAYGQAVRTLRAMNVSFSDIADRLGMSESTAKSIFYKN